MFYNRQTREYPVQINRTSRPYFVNESRQYGLNRLQQQWPTSSWNQQAWQHATPQTDILELDDQYILEIALPGVVLDDVELKVEENLLTVIAKRTPNMFEERAGYLRKELPCGHLVRHFEFDMEFVHEQIEARMDRGILFVSIPKMEAAMRIPVSAGSIENSMPGSRTRVSSKSEKVHVK